MISGTAKSPFCYGGDSVADLVIRNALLRDSAGERMADIGITGSIITSVGGAENCGCRTIDAGCLSVTAGRSYVCRGDFGENGEDLLFSGYSTLIFEHCASSPPVSELIKTAMNTLLNFAVISRCKSRDLPYDDGTLTVSDAEMLSKHLGSVAVGMMADLYFRSPQGRLEKVIKGGRLIFDRLVTDRRDIIYAMSSPERSAFFTTKSAAAGYLGKKLRGERKIIAVV